MLVRFKVNVADCVRAGVNPPRDCAEVNVDVAQLSQEDRDTLARFVGSDGKIQCYGSLAHPTLPTFESLLEFLAEKREAIRKEEIKETERKELCKQETWECIKNRTTRDTTSFASATRDKDGNPKYESNSWSNDWSCPYTVTSQKFCYQYDEEVANSEESLAWKQELDVENQRRYEEACKISLENYDKYQKDQEDHKAEVARRAQEFLDWAKTYGSELLQARIEEGFEWEKLAEQEYANQIMESLKVGFISNIAKVDGIDNYELHDRTTPTFAELTALRSMRKEIEYQKADAEVSLGWAVESTPDYVPDDYDYDEAVTRQKFAVLAVEINIPNGSSKERFFRFVD